MLDHAVALSGRCYSVVGRKGYRQQEVNGQINHMLGKDKSSEEEKPVKVKGLQVVWHLGLCKGNLRNCHW